MSKLLVPQLTPSIGQMAGWHIPEPQEDSPPLAIATLRTLQTWIGRHRQRKALAELAATNNYLLQDIGVSQDAAFREAAKPFWQR
jgi:uncharacterized protein YjiS (DUF1127 family)